MLTKSEFAERILSGHTTSINEKAIAFAPANIALVKYWGKRDSKLNLPVTDSLSIDLGSLGTETTIEHSPDEQDTVILNGNKLAQDDAFAVKVINFVDLFRSALNQAAPNRPALTCPCWQTWGAAVHPGAYSKALSADTPALILTAWTPTPSPSPIHGPN